MRMAEHRQAALCKAKRILPYTTAMLLALCAGCINVFAHIDGTAYPFGGTVECAKGIATPFVGADGPEAGIEEAWATILLPILVVELPFEVVADVATLPYDVYKKCKGAAK